MSTKFDQVCRVCLHENVVDSTPLFISNCGSTREAVAERLRLCTGVVFHKADNLPQVVCHDCLQELQVAETLRRKCLVSEMTLWDYARTKIERIEPATVVKEEPKISSHSDNVYFDREPLEQSTKEFMELPDGLDSPDVFEAQLDRKLHVEFELQPIKATVEYSCSECGKRFKTKANMTKHIFKHHTSDKVDVVKKLQIKQDTEHVCSECGKCLKTRVSLEKHVFSMHERRKRVGRVTGHGESRLFHCLECDYTTKHGQSLVYHTRTHTGEKPHRCECGAAFAQPGPLATHRRTHSDKTSHTCFTCGKQFKLKIHFERHQYVHSASTFSCPKCGKKLKTPTSLKAHMNRHLGMRNFSCEWCGVAFVTNSELCNHRKKHDKTQRERFQCHLCSYKTYTKQGLRVHLKRHAGERKFKCSLCQYDCTTRGELTSHQLSHTKVKRYPCPHCGTRFLRSSYLNKHVRRVHNEHFTWNDTIDRKLVPVIPADGIPLGTKRHNRDVRASGGTFANLGTSEIPSVII